MPRSINGSPYPFLSVREIQRHMDEIYDRNVSETARGSNPDRIGFLEVYQIEAQGKASQLHRIMATKNSSWMEKRNNYIRRSLAGAASTPVKDRWWKNGRPTRRHLALIVRAYTPTPRRLARYRG